MIDNFERTIRRTLRQLARQRVRMVLQPGNYWVIDNTGKRGEDTPAALATCFMRGWIEPLEHAVPSKELPADFKLPKDWGADKVETQYRLTSAGWSAIHRSNTIAIVALLISVFSFAVVLLRAVIGAL